MAESTPSQPATAASDKIAEAWAKLRLGHEAVMLQDAEATLRTDRERVKAHQREFLGPSWRDPEGEGVIHIGDVHQPPTVVSPVAQPAGLSTLGKIAVGGALALLAGTPIGAAVLAVPVLQALLNRPAPVVTQPTATPQPQPTVDQTLYDLRLGKPTE